MFGFALLCSIALTQTPAVTIRLDEITPRTGQAVSLLDFKLPHTIERQGSPFRVTYGFVSEEGYLERMERLRTQQMDRSGQVRNSTPVIRTLSGQPASVTLSNQTSISQLDFVAYAKPEVTSFKFKYKLTAASIAEEAGPQTLLSFEINEDIKAGDALVMRISDDRRTVFYGVRISREAS